MKPLKGRAGEGSPYSDIWARNAFIYHHEILFYVTTCTPIAAPIVGSGETQLLSETFDFINADLQNINRIDDCM